MNWTCVLAIFSVRAFSFQGAASMAAKPPYVEALGSRDTFGVLGETRGRLLEIAKQLGTNGLRKTYAPGKWTGAQIIAHLADCEVAFGYRVRQIVAEPSLPIQPFDQDLWAGHYAAFDGLAAAEAFAAIRAWNLTLFERLTPEELARAAPHPARGPETALTEIRIIAGHTLHHLAQLEKILAG